MNVSLLPKVYIFRPVPVGCVNRLRQHCQVREQTLEENKSWDKTLSAISGMDGLIVHSSTRTGKEILDAAGPQLKVISTLSVGLDHMDLNICKQRGVKVGHTPDVLTASVTELTIGLLLATARRFGELFNMVREGVWRAPNDFSYMAGKQLAGSTVGIVGLGRVGLATAKLLSAFGVSHILYTGRNPRPDSANTVGAEFVTFQQLLQQSDFVVAACSLNDHNKGLFGTDAFKLMKPSSIFINIGRGRLVDQEALFEALSTGQIGAAGLDVTTPEPLPPSHPLLRLPNCIVTPHMAHATDVAIDGMCSVAVDNLLAGLEGTALKASAI